MSTHTTSTSRHRLERLWDQDIWDDAAVASVGGPRGYSPLVSIGGSLGTFSLVDFLRIAGMPTTDIRIVAPHHEPPWWGSGGPSAETPPYAAVRAGIEHEATRIHWDDMVVTGQASTVRRRAEGGYFVVVESSDEPVVFRCDFVHVAVGYPPLRRLPDVERYRERFPHDERLVHALEPHQYVYEALTAAPSTVLVRGNGITASRVVQQLIDDREQRHAQTRILHLLGSACGPDGPRMFRRPSDRSGEPVTAPKAAGGEPTAADRKAWSRRLARGRSEGWYRAVAGTVSEFDQAPGGQVRARLHADRVEVVTLSADYVIDTMGLDPDIRQHPLLAELLDHAGARSNACGRLDVGVDFEVRGTRSGTGRLYASGASAVGGYLPPADSFWGLSHAALEICDSLARNGLCRRIGSIQSANHWLRWMRANPI